MAINSDGTASGSRHSLPFGNLRKEAGEWPSERGFLNGTKAADLGLTHLGAREYAAQLGVFMSPDPIMDLTDPQQWNAYAYANSNPTTMADPSGLLFGPACGPDGIFCADVAAKMKPDPTMKPLPIPAPKPVFPPIFEPTPIPPSIAAPQPKPTTVETVDAPLVI